MKPPLPERLATALLIELASGNYQEGRRFLSRREVMHHWKVSCLTATRSLEILTSWNLLKASDRSGHYLEKGHREHAMVLLKSPPARSLPASPDWHNKARTLLHGSIPLKRIAVIILSDVAKPEESSTSAKVLDNIATFTFTQSAKSIFKASTEKNVTVDFYLDDGQEQTRQHIIGEIRTSMTQGAIIFKRILTSSVTPLAKELIKLGLPVVTAFDDCEQINMVSVNFNNVLMGHAAANTFIEAGHTRIGVALPPAEEKPYYFKDRLLGCELAAKENVSHPITIEPITVQDQPGAVNEGHSDSFALENPDRLTALFVTSVHLMPLLQPTLDKLNINIPKDLSVILCSVTPNIPSFNQPFDIIKLDFERIGTESFQALEALYKGQSSDKIQLIQSLYEASGTVTPIHRS